MNKSTKKVSNSNWVYHQWTPGMSKEEWAKKNKENWDMFEEANGKVSLIKLKSQKSC